MSELPLAAAAMRLRRRPGRPRRVTATAPPIGSDIQRAPSEAASEAAADRDFATTLLHQAQLAGAVRARALTLPLAAAYSGVPVRGLWRFISAGMLHPIRPPGCRRVLVDRLELDGLLESWKQAR